MSGFSPEWLALREPADARARNRDVLSALSGWFALRDEMSILDLGAGTGANLRALAPHLSRKQKWILADNDGTLFLAARRALSAWADQASSDGDALKLEKSGQQIEVAFLRVDLARDLATALAGKPDLVTASALFDLVSSDFIKNLARLVTDARAAFYSALTYNGIQRWTPHRPADSQMAAAFNRHQMTDKGFGPAAGPTAAGLLADQFRLAGFNVLEGESPWRLAPSDRALLEELQRGFAMAVLETNAVDAKAVETWVKVIRAGAETGHTDTFAVPA